MRKSTLQVASNGKSKNLPRDIYRKTRTEILSIPPLPRNTSYVISADPGLEGAVAVIKTDGALVKIMEYDDKPALRKLIWNHRHDAVFTGEDPVSAVRGVSGSSNPPSVFRFGRNTGWWEAMVYALTGGVPLLLSPSAWKKEAGLIGTKKEAVITTARTLCDDKFDFRKNDKCKNAWTDACDAYVIGMVYLALADGMNLATVDWTCRIRKERRYPNEL